MPLLARQLPSASWNRCHITESWPLIKGNTHPAQNLASRPVKLEPPAFNHIRKSYEDLRQFEVSKLRDTLNARVSLEVWTSFEGTDWVTIWRNKGLALRTKTSATLPDGGQSSGVFGGNERNYNIMIQITISTMQSWQALPRLLIIISSAIKRVTWLIRRRL